MKTRSAYEREQADARVADNSPERIDQEDAYTARKEALDRAIRYHTNLTSHVIDKHGISSKPTDIIDTAVIFERYLARPANVEA